MTFQLYTQWGPTPQFTDTQGGFCWVRIVLRRSQMIQLSQYLTASSAGLTLELLVWNRFPEGLFFAWLVPVQKNQPCGWLTWCAALNPTMLIYYTVTHLLSIYIYIIYIYIQNCFLGSREMCSSNWQPVWFVVPTCSNYVFPFSSLLYSWDYFQWLTVL